MRKRTLALLVAVVMTVMVMPGAVTAAPGGNGNGQGNGNGNGKAAREAAASCVVEGNMVHGTNLPGDELINFMVTDASGTTGWVLGHNSEGWWDVPVPDRTSDTTYEFVSRTWGPNGSKYTVFASCTAGV